MWKILFIIPAIYFLSSCEKPCPPDIKAGELYFSAATNALLPAADPARTIEFQSMNGNTITFVNEANNWKRNRHFNVETVCTGDLSHQVKPQYLYFDAPAYFASYVTNDKQYWLSYTYELVNSGPFGKAEDTLFHEQLCAFGYKEGKPFDARLVFFTSLRGNDSRLPNSVKSLENVKFLTDTIVGNKTLYNVYTQQTTIEDYFRIFYSSANGIEAFTLSNGEIWLRKS